MYINNILILGLIILLPVVDRADSIRKSIPGGSLPGGEGFVGCLLRPDRGPAASQGDSSGPNLSIPPVSK